MPPNGTVLGIDLGTTFSEIAYVDVYGKPVTIRNREGDFATPSVILFEDEAIVVGREAKRVALVDPDRVVQCIKREMGNPSFRFQFRGKEYSPETLSAFILMKLKQDAEAQVGPFQDVVITVPAFFDDTRRKATQDAGRIAGLNVVDIINEPTAAALAYGMGIKGDEPQTALVYDLGGGTFDVTLIRIEPDSIRMLATGGDVRLGGKDWDMALANYVADAFLRQCGADPRDDAQSFQALYNEVEEAKKTLSTRSRVRIPCSHAGHRISVDVTREIFERITAHLLGHTKLSTEMVLDDASLTWKDVDKVLLVGGSTRMPMVAQMLRELTKKEPVNSLPVDEIVAHGAAIHGAILRGMFQKKVTNVNSHSLGIIVREKDRDKNLVMIRKNSPLPCSVTKMFRTIREGEREIRIGILEGEAPDPSACIKIGECVISDFSVGLPKGALVEVTYEYTADGRFAVGARELSTGKVASTEIVRESGLSEREVEEAQEAVATIILE